MALNASRDGQPLYESMGYRVTPSPMMFLRWIAAGYNSSALAVKADRPVPTPGTSTTETREHAIHHH